MRRYGFDIVATWESSLPHGPRFVYLLSWPDVQTKEAAWRAFLADEDHLLAPTSYSPATIVQAATRA